MFNSNRKKAFYEKPIIQLSAYILFGILTAAIADLREFIFSQLSFILFVFLVLYFIIDRGLLYITLYHLKKNCNKEYSIECKSKDLETGKEYEYNATLFIGLNILRRSMFVKFCTNSSISHSTSIYIDFDLEDNKYFILTYNYKNAAQKDESPLKGHLGTAEIIIKDEEIFSFSYYNDPHIRKTHGYMIKK
ncbi:MAG: hypothetical protein JEZ05_03005 [Tenericutes bacterium]|nr:hypothetical protein [Mycoplasmatota bacterium]